MKRAFRAVLSLMLALIAAAPASAQSVIPPARKGEIVTVSLKDGRELTGAVGEWVDDVGFYVKPADSAAYLIHPNDIVSLLSTNSSASRSVPLHKAHSGISLANKILIGVAVFIGASIAISAVLPQG
jgi:hypothetical protein